MRRAAEVLAANGAQVEEVSLPWTRAVNDRWSDLWAVFMAAYFGDRLEEFGTRMDPGVVRLIGNGRKLGACEYKRIELLRSAMWRDLAQLFTRYDALLCPTCAVTAPAAERNDGDFGFDTPEGRYRGMDMTGPFNLVSACPAVSVPAGLDGHLPVGVQIVGKRHADEDVLAFAGALESALGLELRPPIQF